MSGAWLSIGASLLFKISSNRAGVVKKEDSVIRNGSLALEESF